MISLFAKFKSGLKKTATSLSRSFSSIVSGTTVWDKSTYEQLEAALLSADFGVKASSKLVSDLRERYARGDIHTSADIFGLAKGDIMALISQNARPARFAPAGQLTVILLVGVNGSGKTTTAGKLAHLWRQDGKKVMLAACDTFRAAAVEQLKLWGERSGAHVVSAKQGADPSAVAFDAVQSALARGMDILLIDTAGRQHTRKGLMEELAKMCRTIGKLAPGAPHEVWLTIDASFGSNAVNQAREFLSTAGVSGLVLTKLDGTGKGGSVVAIQGELSLPGARGTARRSSAIRC